MVLEQGKEKKIMPSRIELELFVKKYIPKGWVGPIEDFDFAPYFSDDAFQDVLEGKIPEGRRYVKWYVKAAIQKWQLLHIKANRNQTP